MIDISRILDKVNQALGSQFDNTYSWENMIDDIDVLTKDEKDFAKKYISYKAYIIEEARYNEATNKV